MAVRRIRGKISGTDPKQIDWDENAQDYYVPTQNKNVYEPLSQRQDRVVENRNRNRRREYAEAYTKAMINSFINPLGNAIDGVANYYGKIRKRK